jgi:DNA polymerase I-like protein with 3'-5' exonuclease and polymerase domains
LQATALFQLGGAVESALDTQRLLEPFRLIEMPLLRVLGELAFYGMRIGMGLGGR